MKETTKRSVLLTDEVIMNKIYLVRSQKVMVDRDLAALYGVETKVLKQGCGETGKGFRKTLCLKWLKMNSGIGGHNL